jgi:hypothetical protein
MNQEFQLRSSQLIASSLQEHVRDGLMRISIVISLAIPFQFLLLHRSSRAEARLGLATAMRDVARIIERTGYLFNNLLISPVKDPAFLQQEVLKLRADISASRQELLGLHGNVE